MYSDLNADGIISTPSEILEETHYYPSFQFWGRGPKIEIVMDGPWMSGGEMNYTYNGYIRQVGEGSHLRIEDFMGLDMNLATYRALDPELGRWTGVDPKAEATMSLTTYGAMNQNPVSNVDPEGDLAFLAAVGIGAVTGGITNGWDGVWKGALVGAIGGAIPQIGFISNLGNVGSGAITGAITGGLNSGLYGESILRGAAIGAAIGASVGLIQDGIQHHKEAQAARRELIDAGYDPNGSVPMSKEGLQKFVTKHDELFDMYLNAGTPDMYAGRAPAGYSIDKETMLFRSGKKFTAGATNTQTGAIHISPARFKSAIKLYSTLGHEFHHSIDVFNGTLNSFSSQFGSRVNHVFKEVQAHTWQVNLGRKLGGFEVGRHLQAISNYQSTLTKHDYFLLTKNIRI